MCGKLYLFHVHSVEMNGEVLTFDCSQLSVTCTQFFAEPGTCTWNIAMVNLNMIELFHLSTVQADVWLWHRRQVRVELLPCFVCLRLPSCSVAQELCFAHLTSPCSTPLLPLLENANTIQPCILNRRDGPPRHNPRQPPPPRQHPRLHRWSGGLRVLAVPKRRISSSRSYARVLRLLRRA